MKKGQFDVIPQLLLFTNDSRDFSDAAIVLEGKRLKHEFKL